MNEEWDLIIKPQQKLLNFNLKEIWQYRDLLTLFVKRDIVTLYKQTVLGPIWFFVQPIMTMLVYIVIFGNVAGISTDGIPKPLFYLSGIIIWNYFSGCFMETSNTFSTNQDMFGKVYFPRLIIPLSKVVSGLIKFAIQFLLFLIIYIYFIFDGVNISASLSLLFIPLFLLIMAGIGLGLGLIFTAMTTKYRDLQFLIQFGVQLLMYTTPIIYPMSSVEGNLKTLIYLNPLAHIVEAFKYSFLGQGELSLYGLGYASLFTIVILISGVLIFNKTERNFVDTI